MWTAPMKFPSEVILLPVRARPTFPCTQHVNVTNDPKLAEVPGVHACVWQPCCECCVSLLLGYSCWCD